MCFNHSSHATWLLIFLLTERLGFLSLETVLPHPASHICTQRGPTIFIFKEEPPHQLSTCSTFYNCHLMYRPTQRSPSLIFIPCIYLPCLAYKKIGSSACDHCALSNNSPSNLDPGSVRTNQLENEPVVHILGWWGRHLLSVKSSTHGAAKNPYMSSDPTNSKIHN